MDAMSIEARLKAARDEVDDLCHAKHGWRMCIPVQPTDSDVVISAALNDLEALLAHITPTVDEAGAHDELLNVRRAVWLEAQARDAWAAADKLEARLMECYVAAEYIQALERALAVERAKHSQPY